MSERVGHVVIVGAGPGSADLITVRGARRLAQADLVLYDALASEELRTLAPAARWFFVGKRACRQSISQDVLNRLLVKYARRGLRVVRLKCGDPYVFGRGGEEALALARAGIPFEIVPGVSSAVAAPALAGIPVTHRGLASSFAVVTGHHETTYGPLLDGLPPGALTLVVLMGLGQRARIAERLLARGWSADTPAAVIVGAATAQSWSWTGTLASLGDRGHPGGVVGRARAAGGRRRRGSGRGARGRAVAGPLDGGGAMSLVVKNLTKRFTARGTPAVADVSFAAPSGGITTLLGPSGSGKSTVLRVVAGLEQPDSGTILFGDDDVTNLPAQKRGLGFVFQSYALFKHMTVRRNIAFGLDVRKGATEGPTRRRPGARSTSCCRWCSSTAWASATRRSCPAASASGSRSRARSPSSRRCCCSTSRSARWTRRCASSCATGCAASTTSTTSRPCW